MKLSSVLARFPAATAVLALAAAAPVFAQNAPADAPAAAVSAAVAQPKVIAVGKVKASSSVAAAAARKKISMDRVVQALDSQLIDRLQATRKYQVIARSDADSLIEEAGATGRAFDFGNADYLLVVTVDDFQDVTQEARFAALGTSAKKRVIRLSAVGKVYDARTNRIVETANFQEQNLDTEETVANITTDGELSDALLVGMARNMAEKIARRVVDIGYPARVVARTGKIVTLNRGDGTGIEPGQLWEAFAVGDNLVDPDTGASLGREEVPVGKLRIIRVNPQTSLGEVTGEDLGIAKGAVLRRVEN
ncbi:uncharacterized protein involved in formation of curli polymers [Opitutaceae bacterium TAV1]|nr:uncharacterized protein involved in formation of curli polymers [Opitutaceae bacterium TAV1]